MPGGFISGRFLPLRLSTSIRIIPTKKMGAEWTGAGKPRPRREGPGPDNSTKVSGECHQDSDQGSLSRARVDHGGHEPCLGSRKLLGNDSRLLAMFNPYRFTDPEMVPFQGQMYNA